MIADSNTLEAARIRAAKIAAELSQFTGSDCVYRHSLNPGVVYSEGVRYLAQEASAYWLIDAITSYFGSPEMRRALSRDGRLADLQFWQLVVTEESAELTMRADSGVAPAITQRIAFTDFPLPEANIWAGYDGHRWTLYLPSEH